MKLYKNEADIFIPDNSEETVALKRTTHLSITAHQDDTEIAAVHGIVNCFGSKDKWFTGVTMSNGSGSPRAGVYATYSDEEMVEIRHDEQRKAAVIGDYAAHLQLRYSSSELKDGSDNNSVNDIVKILKATSPEVVYLHNPADKHDTHVAVTLRSIAALRQLSPEELPEKVYGCEVWRNLDWVNDDEKVILPVSGDDNMATALISVFDSQVAGGKRYDLASAGRRLANATYFASHDTDDFDGMNFAVDLTPLIKDHSLSVAQFIIDTIERFKNDVQSKIEKMS